MFAAVSLGFLLAGLSYGVAESASAASAPAAKFALGILRLLIISNAGRMRRTIACSISTPATAKRKRISFSECFAINCLDCSSMWMAVPMLTRVFCLCSANAVRSQAPQSALICREHAGAICADADDKCKARELFIIDSSFRAVSSNLLTFRPGCRIFVPQ